MVKRRRKVNGLSRRETQIMAVLYKLGKASVADVLDKLPDRRNYSTVRAQLRVLEEKRLVRHETKKLRYLYAPTVPRQIAQRSALRHMIETFFDGSVENSLATILTEDNPPSPHYFVSALVHVVRLRGADHYVDLSNEADVREMKSLLSTFR